MRGSPFFVGVTQMEVALGDEAVPLPIFLEPNWDWVAQDEPMRLEHAGHGTAGAR